MDDVIRNGDLDDVTTPSQSTKSQSAYSSVKVVMEGVVKRVTSVFGFNSPCLNLILQSKPYPRLYITSTLDSDGREGIYKKDILLYGSLKVTLKNP